MKIAILLALFVALAAAVPDLRHVDRRRHCCPDDIVAWNACRSYTNPADCENDPDCMWCPYRPLDLMVLLDIKFCRGHNKNKCICPHNPPAPNPNPGGICYPKVAPTCILVTENNPDPIIVGASCLPGIDTVLESGKCPDPKHHD
jgi:hypothetical protein